MIRRMPRTADQPGSAMTANIIPELHPLAFPIDKLRELPGNPNIGDDRSVALSYERFGQRKPIVARRSADGTGVVTAGNTQLRAARDRLAWTHIAVVWPPDDDATAKAFAIADNRTAQLGTTDEVALAAMLDEVRREDEVLFTATSYDDDTLKALMMRFAPTGDDGERLDVSAERECPSCGFRWRMSGGEVEQVATANGNGGPPAAPTDELSQAVQGVLSPDLIKPGHSDGNSPHALDGHCYAATEAYLHLAGPDAGLRSMTVKHGGESHWWLEDADGRIIDLTLAGDEYGTFWPYADGRAKGFMRGKGPDGLSARAATIVQRVESARTVSRGT